MNEKYLKFFSVLFAFVLMFQVIAMSSTDALAAEKTGDFDLVLSNSSSSNENQNDVQPLGNSITLYFKNIAVAALTLGTISYITGKAPAEWVKWGLTATEKKIKDFANSASYVPGKPIYVASNGDIHACVVFPCAIATSVPLQAVEF